MIALDIVAARQHDLLSRSRGLKLLLALLQEALAVGLGLPTIVILLLQAIQPVALLRQERETLALLGKLLRPEHVLLFLLPIKCAGLCEFLAPCLQFARLVGEPVDLKLLGLHLFFVLLLRIQ